MASAIEVLRQRLREGFIKDDDDRRNVTFLFTGTEERVLAHKDILGLYSRVLERLIFEGVELPDVATIVQQDGGNNGMLVVRLQNMSVDAFRLILKFIYFQDVSWSGVDTSVGLGLLRIATVLQMPEIIFVGKEYLKRNFNADKALQLLREVIEMGNGLEELRCQLSGYIARRGKEMLDHEDFLKLPLEGVGLILKSDELCVQELDVFRTAVRWAEARIRSDDRRMEGIPITGEQIRQVLGEIRFLIRFPLIECKDFTAEVYKLRKGFLSDEEALRIYQYNPSDPDSIPHPFSVIPRHEKTVVAAASSSGLKDTTERVRTSSIGSSCLSSPSDYIDGHQITPPSGMLSDTSGGSNESSVENNQQYKKRPRNSSTSKTPSSDKEPEPPMKNARREIKQEPIDPEVPEIQAEALPPDHSAATTVVKKEPVEPNQPQVDLNSLAGGIEVPVNSATPEVLEKGPEKVESSQQVVMTSDSQSERQVPLQGDRAWNGIDDAMESMFMEIGGNQMEAANNLQSSLESSGGSIPNRSSETSKRPDPTTTTPLTQGSSKTSKPINPTTPSEPEPETTQPNPTSPIAPLTQQALKQPIPISPMAPAERLPSSSQRESLSFRFRSPSPGQKPNKRNSAAIISPRSPRKAFDAVLDEEEEEYVKLNRDPSSSNNLAGFYQNILAMNPEDISVILREDEPIVVNANSKDKLTPLATKNLMTFKVAYLYPARSVQDLNRYLTTLRLPESLLFVTKDFDDEDMDQMLKQLWIYEMDLQLTVNGITILKLDHGTKTLVMSRICNNALSILMGMMGEADVKHVHLEELNVGDLERIPSKCLETLTLKNFFVGTRKDQLPEFLRGCKHLKKLSWFDHTTVQEKVDIVSDLLIVAPNLQKIALGNTEIQLNYLANLTTPNVTELYLTKCTWMPEFVEHFSALFPFLKKFKMVDGNLFLLEKVLQVDSVEWVGIWDVKFTGAGRSRGGGRTSEFPKTREAIRKILIAAGLDQKWATSEVPKTFLLERVPNSEDNTLSNWKGTKIEEHEKKALFESLEYEHFGWDVFYSDCHLCSRMARCN